jgi:LemA protein
VIYSYQQLFMAATRSFWKYGIIVVIVLLGLWAFSSYNGLVTERENVDTSWRQVETQYQRRYDLIPNLVNTVQGSADFEQETLTAVTEARTQWQSASAEGDREEQVAAAQQTESALARLLVTVEAYPQLTSTAAFRDLMAQLEGTENRISVARMDYNNAVREYNLLVKRFPGNIMAGLFGFDDEPGFESDEGAEDAPPVEFD